MTTFARRSLPRSLAAGMLEIHLLSAAGNLSAGNAAEIDRLFAPWDRADSPSAAIVVLKFVKAYRAPVAFVRQKHGAVIAYPGLSPAHGYPASSIYARLSLAHALTNVTPNLFLIEFELEILRPGPGPGHQLGPAAV